ncbi:hypothetical protein SXCC_02080 [Gluconacetobacter sp. SXCC-1]|nr:hypothetical protein SXCC_02080 [Gluconacetobacter sp. SXCC-1]
MCADRDGRQESRTHPPNHDRSGAYGAWIVIDPLHYRRLM